MKMNNVLILIVTLFVSTLIQAQNIPDFVNFQGIARDTGGNVISNSFIQVRFSIIDSNETATNKVIYKEFHVKKTDVFGQFNSVLNENSTVEASKFNSLNLIPWYTGKKYVFIEYKPTIGQPYIPFGIIRCNSVWYSFASKTSENLVNFNLAGATDGQLLKYNASTKTWNPSVDNGVPAGTIIAYGGSTVPEGWLMCDGTSYPTASYPALSAAIGNNWGSGGNGSFNVPDLRGRFLRGVDGGTGRDPQASSRIGVSPNGVGSIQEDAYQGHHHYALGETASRAVGPNTGWGINAGQQAPSAAGAGNSISDGSNGTPRISPETRPKNAYVIYIIKK